MRVSFIPLLTQRKKTKVKNNHFDREEVLALFDTITFVMLIRLTKYQLLLF